MIQHHSTMRLHLVVYLIGPQHSLGIQTFLNQSVRIIFSGATSVCGSRALLVSKILVAQVDRNERLGELDPAGSLASLIGTGERTYVSNLALSVPITSFQSWCAVRLLRGAHPMACRESSCTSSGSKAWQPGLTEMRIV